MINGNISFRFSIFQLKSELQKKQLKALGRIVCKVIQQNIQRKTIDEWLYFIYKYMSHIDVLLCGLKVGCVGLK